MMSRGFQFLGGWAAAALIAASGSMASAQNALGDGRRLDNNLQQGVGRVNAPSRDFAREAQFRNAIVTGNVAGGFGFRGNVGYTAADDFRGSLGSTQNFGFARDSFYSALGGRGLRAVDALQAQMNFSTGGQVDPNLGVPIIRRPGAGFSAAQLLAQDADTEKGRQIQTVSAFTLREGSLRSTSDWTAGRPLSPRVLGRTDLGEMGEPGDTLRFFVSSPLRGIGLQKTPELQRPLPPDLIQDRPETARLDNRIENQPETGRVEAKPQPYEKLLADLRAAAEEAKEAEAEKGAGAGEREGREGGDLEQKVQDLIDRAKALPEGVPTREEEDDGGAPGTGTGAGGRGGAEGRSSPLRGVPRPLEEEDREPRTLEERMEKLMERLTPSAKRVEGDPWAGLSREDRSKIVSDAEELLGRIRPKVDELAGESDSLPGNAYTAQMRAGEAALGQGKWFDAEERFSVALQIRKGDPMAAAGRLNAQLAAGLFLSAAQNLEALLRGYPEMINAQFDRRLLPTPKRLEQVREELRGAISRDPASGQRLGLLLAYLGRQFNNPEDVRAGFAAIEEATRLGAPDDPLVDVLESLWGR